MTDDSHQLLGVSNDAAQRLTNSVRKALTQFEAAAQAAAKKAPAEKAAAKAAAKETAKKTAKKSSNKAPAER